MKKIYIRSLGCPKNLVDTEIMAGLLAQAGHELTDLPDNADVAIVNTCGFIQSAKEESLDAVFEAVRQKETNPALRVVVTGCLAQRYASVLSSDIPEIDAILGVNDLGRICEAIETSGGRSVRIDDPPFLPTFATPRRRVTPAHIAYLKIADGCSHRCTFCAIPAIRGKLRSRAGDDIVREAERLLQEGVKELILIGQDTTSFGRDRGERNAIVPLLKRLGSLGGEYWLRLMYAYPSEISEELLAAIASSRNICRYLDIPFQHADADILARMGRRGDAELYLSLIEKARSALPGLALRSSLIVGFPGETPEAFRRLVQFVKDAALDNLGVFAYSDEEGTPASELDGQVDSREAEKRRDRLMRLQLGIIRKKQRENRGKVVQVVVDGIRDDADFLVQARTEGQAPDVDGVVYLTEGAVETLSPGRFVQARLKRSLDYDFTAELIS